MRKQRKPYVTPKHGKLYYRLRWTEDGKRRERYIPLPGEEDSPEFDREYWAIRSGTSEQVQKAPSTCWENLIRHYKTSVQFRKLAPGTRRKYDPVIEALREKNGRRDVRKVTRSDVRAIHEKYADTPRKADLYVQVIRMLLNFAKRELDWITANPAEGMRLYGPQKEWQPWPEPAQKAFCATCEALGDEMTLTAFHLGTGTGQRPGDLCAMRWDHYDGEFIAVVQDKTDERLWIYCPEELRAYLDALPKRGRYILAKNLTEPLGYDAIERRFSAVRAKAGDLCDGLVMHGWRYTAAVELAEAGCSDAQIMAVTGHKTASMVAKYRRQAGQKRLAKQAQSRRGRT
ncbi:tyrosine-type recombinase/integrase [Pseudodonghicola sp.]|uniref:tyrosine-type recombinase/integrase n=1 Tax=Pseudodonghicola sp. TaxID=1969463 RepID=UPI003A974ABB